MKDVIKKAVGSMKVWVICYNAALSKGDLKDGTAMGSTERRSPSQKKRSICITAYDTEAVLVFFPASFEFPK